MRLASARLDIRPLHSGDEQDYCDSLADPVVSGRLAGSIGPAGDIRFIAELDRSEVVALFHRRAGETIDGMASRYAIMLRAGERLIGSIGSYPIDDKSVGLSYWVAAGWQGKGLGTEAARTYCLPALRLFSKRLMLANVADDNGASSRSLHKVGFTAFDAAARPHKQIPPGRTFLQLDLAAAEVAAAKVTSP
jgi:RimJ/RimL family protein N-acetyltransferase